MLHQENTALYIRVAAKDDFSVEKQISALRRYADENGYQGVSVYVDNGFSGLTTDRPGFDRLKGDI